MGASVRKTEYDVRVVEGYVRAAEAKLQSAKMRKKQAQANGNYKNAQNTMKTYVAEVGKSLNYYDYDIYAAQKVVKERKAELAAVKKAAKKK